MKISEEKIIDLVSKNINFREEIIVPIGEDASVIFPQQALYMVITTDTMVENTHFRANISPYELGYISAASNISDLSAMGANPAFALINLTVEDKNKEYIKQFIKGYDSIFKNLNVTVIGGDTTCGPMNITMTLIGYTKSNNFMLTSSAKIDDKIFISGSLGNSMAKNRINNYFLPEIRSELGQILTDFANCCTDMSDGILKSLKKITNQSDVGANIYLDKIIINSELNKPLIKKEITWEDILGYGEDYELLFTVNNKNAKILKKICEEININIYEVGSINNKKKVSFYEKNELINININNYFEHFKNEK